MLFNSLAFLVFFPLVTALYFALPHRARWLLLLAASCWFYMAFIPVYILILIFTILVDYVAGILIEDAQGLRRRVLLLLSLVANVGVLAVFKYWNFAADNLNQLAAALHLGDALVPALRLVLPIGLSFHTFQAMSYTIEVYRNRQKAERHLGIYALYVLFYPQLVAGPIERPQNLLHQFREPHAFDAERVAQGLQLILWGLFKKVVIADRLAILANAVYDAPLRYHGLPVILATVFFAFQIYCDFSGYSDIARGCARVMGFELMLNFDHPYSAGSISEFWRRWHISLSTWFRDYLFVPLGGSRGPLGVRCRNLLVVFVVSGLWHGASWNYVIWGGLHGLFLVTSILTGNARAWVRARLGLAEGSLPLRAFRIAFVFTLVCVTWVFFRARTLTEAMHVLRSMGVGLGEGLSRLPIGPGQLALGTALIGVLLAADTVLLRRPLHVLLGAWPGWARVGAYYALACSLLLLGVTGGQQFIYFQF